MWWFVASALASDRCQGIEQALAHPPALRSLALPPDVVPASPTGWTDQIHAPPPARVAAGLGAVWVVRGGRLWRASGGELRPVDLPFAPDLVAVAGERLAVVAQAAGGLGHLAWVDATGAVEREIAWNADVRGIVARGGSWWVAVRGRPPSPEGLRSGLIAIRENGVETKLFGCESLEVPSGRVDRWEGLVEIPASGAARGVAAALGPVPVALGPSLAWAVGKRVFWLAPDQASPLAGAIPLPAVEVEAGAGGVAVRWEARGEQGISVLGPGGAGLAERMRRSANGDNPDGGGIAGAQAWLGWVRDATTPSSGWRVMFVDLADGKSNAVVRNSLPVPVPADDPVLEAALAALEPKPTWYLPATGEQWLGSAALGAQRVGATSRGVVAVREDGSVAWSSLFPPPAATEGPKDAPYHCSAGRSLAPGAWTLVEIGETTAPQWSGLESGSSALFASRGALWSWDGARAHKVAGLPTGVTSMDFAASPLAVDGAGRVLELVGRHFKWTKLPVPEARQVVRGPGGPAVVARDGTGAYGPDGLLLAPNDRFGPIDHLAGGAAHLAVSSSAPDGGVQLLEAGERTPLGKLGADLGEVHELVAPDAIFALGLAPGGRPAAWGWDDQGEFTVIRGDLPLLPGGVPPEALGHLAARDGRLALHVSLRGGGDGVISVQGCAISPVLGDGDGNALDGATVASPWAIGGDGSILVAVPLGQGTGLWELWVARPPGEGGPAH